MPSNSSPRHAVLSQAAQTLSALFRSAGNPKRKGLRRQRRLAWEVLENRRVLAGYFDRIADEVSGPNSAMSSITSGLRSVSSVAKLPLINKPLKDISQLTDTLTTFQSDLDSALRSLNESSAATEVRDVIFGALGPSGARVLASKTGAQEVVPDDVRVTVGSNSVEVSIDLGYTSGQFASAVGLGVDSVPFQAANNTNTGEFTVGLKYQDLRFGYNTIEGVYLRTDTSNNELQLTLNGFLPSSFIAGLGFLNVRVTDKTAAADLTLTVSADITGGTRDNDPPISISPPKLTGGVNLKADVEVQISEDGMPKLATEMVFQWELPNVSTSTPFGGAWGAPVLQFNHVTIELGSMLGSLVKPIANDVRAILKPLQPVFDTLEKRIPGVSDISEALGAGEVNLLSLSSALRSLPSPPTEILNIVDQAQKLRDYARKIQTLASVASGRIDVGSFNISGRGQNSLLDTARSAIGDLGLGEWSQLFSPSQGINVQGFKDQIRALPLPAGIGDEINSLWDQLSSASDGTGLAFTFPIVNQPSDVLLGMLLGQEKDLITVTLKLQEEFDASFQIPIIPLFFVQVDARGDIDAMLRLGYDTRGLQEAIAPLYASGNFDVGKVLNGLWIDTASHLDIRGDVGVGVGAGVPELATFTVTGGLSGSLHANIANPNRRAQKIRPFVPGDLTDRLFDVNGGIYGGVKAELKVGVDSPFGFIGFDKSWDFVRTPLYEFKTDRLEIPTSILPPKEPIPQLYTYVASSRTLVLHAGPNARARNLSNDEIKEDFTINVVQSTGSVNTVDVSAFGITQRFIGFVDRVFADMGDGEDSLKVIDPGSLILYSLRGGDGNDLIEVEGSVDVAIQGGAGNDTIDAGNGRNSTHLNSVNGGPDSDEITFGKGQLSNLVQGAVFYIVRDAGDISRDRVTLENSRARVNTGYVFYRNIGAYDVSLNIYTVDDNPDRWIYMSQYDAMTIRSGSGNDVFSGLAPAGSMFYGGAGNDRFSTGRADEDPLPVGPITIFNYPSYTFDGGAGFDSLSVNDSLTRTARNYLLSVNPDNSGSARISWSDNSTTGFREIINGIEDTKFTAYTTGVVTVSGWDTGNLTLSAGEVRLRANSNMWWSTSIAVDYAPKITFFDTPDMVSNSTAGLDKTGPYINLPGGHRINLDLYTYADLTRLVSFQTKYSRIDLTPELLTTRWNVSFDGPADSEVSIVSPNYASPTGVAPNYGYTIDRTALRINSAFWNYTSIGLLRIYSGQGNDELQIKGPLSSRIKVLYDGGFGTDGFTADDRLNNSASLWIVKPDEVTNLFRYSVDLLNTEGSQVLGGPSDDDYILFGVFNDSVAVQGGGGNDRFTIGQQDLLVTFAAPARIDGGDGNDSFAWYGTNNATSQITNPVSLIGGAGINALVVDDKSRSANPFTYDIDFNRITAKSQNSGAWADFYYFGMSAVTLGAGDNDDEFNVRSISNEIAANEQFKILGNGGADTARIYSYDAGYSLLGNLNVSGGLGNDKVVLVNDMLTSGSFYRFYNQSALSTTNLSGIGPAQFGADGDVEQLQILAGSGHDSFTIDSYTSPGTVLNIQAGAGDDSLNFTPVSGRLFSNVASQSRFTFDGGAGTDYLALNNINGIEPAFFARDGAELLAIQLNNSSVINMSSTLFENTSITGGLNFDDFYVDALSSGESIRLHGGAAFSRFNVGVRSQSTQAVRGQIVIEAGNGGGNLFVNNSSSTTGATAHLDSSFLGSEPGDTLFGPGGSLQFRNLTDDPGTGAGITLSMGSGADTVYAAPQLTTSLSISGGAPHTGIGDRLSLSLAGVENPSKLTFSAGAGKLASSNRKDVFWTSIEEWTDSYVAPNVVTVSNALDSGPGSLRQAILDANATPNAAGADVIRFALPGLGPQSIRPLSPLPTITDSLILDATTQPGYAGKPIIELNGSLSTNGNGLAVTSGDTTIRGLAINRFKGSGIHISGNGENVIQGNYIGLPLDGNSMLAVDAQMEYGISILGSSDNLIGTDGDGVGDLTEGNVISANRSAGIVLSDQGEQPTSHNRIAGNRIGTNAVGTAGLPNGDGIRFEGSSDNRVGGTFAAAGNLIAYNHHFGVSVSDGEGNSVLGNAIFDNGKIGIDLYVDLDGPNSVTPNDPMDVDSGPNNYQNYPVLESAFSSSAGAFTIAQGTLSTKPQSSYRIEFFASDTIDPSGYGEGKSYLGFVDATSDADGIVSFAARFSTVVNPGQFITATATDSAGNTSEFSAGAEVKSVSTLTNVFVYNLPSTAGPIVVSSPLGTTISATVSSDPGVALPPGFVFPDGFLNFTVSGATAGASIDVVISGLNLNQVTNYFKYGATPANPSPHWYNFLNGVVTDSDSPVNTGMEVANGNVVLHFIDGKRGDNDLSANGTISSLGGTVLNRTPVAVDDSAATSKNKPVAINVLANDSDPDGTLQAGSVTIASPAAHGTAVVNVLNGVITYTPAANYVGPDSFTYQVRDNLYGISNAATVSIDVKPNGSIVGTQYIDVTGNGLTADDVPMAGVKLYLDINNNGTWNSNEPTTNSLADGTYRFSDLNTGTYKVRQVTPTGYIRTAPTTVDFYTVMVTPGLVFAGNQFANAPLGDLNVLKDVVYVINGMTPVTDLRGNTKEGDTIQVSFTVVAGAMPQRFTLVSYTAPSSKFNTNTSNKQKIFDTDSGVFGPGTHTLMVSNPHSYFQVNFVSGHALSTLGPAGSNIFYTNQNRLFSADNGGKRAPLAAPATLTGAVYHDRNNNGTFDADELPIAGAKLTLSSSKVKQTVVTDMYGVYTFDNLPAGVYSLTETQPMGYADGIDTRGNRGGSQSNDKFTGISLAAGVAAKGYNFGERLVVSTPVAGNQTQSAAWWDGASGQALIKALNGGASSKSLGNWLASNFGNLFGSAAGHGNNLANKTNLQVANFYKSLYSGAARKPESEVMALALSTYVTNKNLAGTTGITYGFANSVTGLGASTVNVASHGASLGVLSNTTLTVTELLLRVNARARKGTIWNADCDDDVSRAESVLRNQVKALANMINNV